MPLYLKTLVEKRANRSHEFAHQKPLKTLENYILYTPIRLNFFSSRENLYSRQGSEKRQQ